jgi:uncharacterized protein YdeI (BOF family)
MSDIPNTLLGVTKLIQRVDAAEKTQQREIRMSIQEARSLINELAILTSKLGNIVSEIHTSLNTIKDSSGNIDVKFDGGQF